ncbi:MAG: AAA family ATPase [Armatimonadota bacterium]|nr:AAA family ATPase [Armatimonadota bacterium]MDR7450252.1 AAA family ATPase [Armatimonadota bacterium]MDR7467165.1 AAA family ATPase [Armatimonadota bacterium]MDR7493293.1 AAA family ATPase [Armatimonadota bacterium]MDR7500142.1 AAA family ATPase [Armatimonadota bacterium]
MILRRLVLRRFLGLPEASFDFAPGLNVIVGPNEAGKSTMRMAIRTVLYENPATTSPRSREQYRSWGADDPPELLLEFELNGRRFTLTKNYAAREVVLTDSLGQSWRAHKAVQERLVAALGLPTDALFDATAHIAQAHLDRIHVSSIGRELGRVIGGGEEDVSAAVRRLDGYLRTLERGSRGAAAREPGALAAAERKVAALRETVEALRRSAAAAEHARRELFAVAAERSRLEESHATKKALLESNREILQLEERLAARRREEQMWEQKVRRIEEYTTRLVALDRELEAATSAGAIDEAATVRLRALHERRAGREQDLAAVRRELEEPAFEPVAWRLPGLAAAAGLLLIVAGGLAVRVLGSWAAVPIALGAAVVAAAIRTGLRAAHRRHLAAARREECERRRQALARELDDLAVETRRLLDRLGCATIEEAEGRLRRYRELVQQRRQTADFLATLREGRDDEAIVEAWKTVRRDLFGLEERLRSPEVAAKRLTPLQVQALEREVPDLEERLAALRRREMRLAVDVERLTAEAEQLAVREEQLHEAEEALARLRRHHRVCRMALEGLLEARRAAEVPLRQVVEEKASEYLRTATAGRYSRMQVEGENLELSVWSEDAGAWVPAEEPQLSRGTVDLVYLAARLALVAVLTGGRRPPLLFDDPFITFDDHRRAAAVRVLRALAAEHQVFLFTCSRHYDAYADRLIELPARGDAAAPAMAPVREAETAHPEPPPPAVGPLWEQR